MQVPAKSEFPGTGANGIAPAIKTQEDWLRNMKIGHVLGVSPLGTKETREIPAALRGMSSTRRVAASDPLRPGGPAT